MTTITDIIANEIAPALGEYADNFDMEAIADQITDWVDGELTITATDGEFWAAVEANDLTA